MGKPNPLTKLVKVTALCFSWTVWDLINKLGEIIKSADLNDDRHDNHLWTKR